MQKYGTAMLFSYSFLGTLNMCAMVAISWPLFIMRTGGSPVLFSPLKLNPKYALYLTGLLPQGCGSAIKQGIMLDHVGSIACEENKCLFHPSSLNGGPKLTDPRCQVLCGLIMFDYLHNLLKQDNEWLRGTSFHGELDDNPCRSMR